MRVFLAAGVAAVVLAVAQPPEEAGVAPGAVPGDSRPGEAFADPGVAELQRTAADVQRELGSLTDQIHTAAARMRIAADVVARTRAEREQADRAVAAQQAEVDRYVSALLGTVGRPNHVHVLLTARSPRDFLDGASLMSRLQEYEAERLTAALRRQQEAWRAEAAAVAAEKDASGRKSDLDRRNGDATNRAVALTSEFRGKLAATNQVVIAQQQAQKERNERTAGNWRAYLDKLATAGLKPQARSSEATLASGDTCSSCLRIPFVP